MAALQHSLWSNAFNSLPRNVELDDYAGMVLLTLAALAYSTKGVLWSKPDPFAYKLYERPQQVLDASHAKQHSRDITVRLQESAADIAVLWASQSGTAERFAGRLAKELASSLGAKAVLLDVSDIDPASYASLPTDKMLILLASTFGEGDPSDNMHELWSWLSNDASLADLRYMAFGLGNSNYKHYNHVVDVLVERFQARGAKSLLQVGKADDANGETEEHFLDWKSRVLNFMQHDLGYERQPYRYEPAIEIIEDASLEPIDMHQGAPAERFSRQSHSQSQVFQLPVAESRELFPSRTGRNCLHMEVDLSEHSGLKYKTGDYLGVWPVNPTEEVDRLIRVLGLQERRHVPIHIKSLDGNAVKIPSPTTVEALLGHYLEICAPVSREHITILSSFAAIPTARLYLEHIGRDKAAYQKYTSERYVNLGRLLEAACSEPSTWSLLPLSFLAEILPPMQPRFYSISSSSVVQPKRAAITAVVSSTALPNGRIPGLTTNYLLAAHGSHPHGMTYSPPMSHGPQSGVRLHAQLRKSTFKLPVVSSTPIIMVGAGTGLAPFRAFIQERARLRTMGRGVGETMLFFGCRHPSEDFIYKSEFEELSSTLGDSFTMHTAFSRPTNGASKSYVQHRMTEEQQEVARLLVDNNAYFYICGSAAMARDVSNTVSILLGATQNWSEGEVDSFMARQRRQKRWLQDVWG